MGAVLLVVTVGAAETLDFWNDSDVRCSGEIVLLEMLCGGLVPDRLSVGDVTSILVVLS